MAKKDAISTTQEYECTKEVDCQWCKTTFQFPIKTSVTGSGPKMSAALDDAEEKAVKELKEEPGQQRCPTCGALQVCMGASSHALGHGCAMWFAGVFLLLSVGAGFLIREKLISFMTMPMITWLLLVISLLAVAYNVFVVLTNPNQDLAKGREEVQENLEKKPVTTISKGNGSVPDSLPKSMSVLQIVAIGLSVFGIAMIPAAEWLRIASGWPVNSSCVPPVAGPGDEVTVYWPKTIECMKGHWRGTVKVEQLDAGPNGQRAAIGATCSTDSWGQFIGGKGAKKRDTAIWTKIALPNDPSLSGKTIQLDAKISVEYPRSTGLFGFEDAKEDFANVFTLKLAQPAAAGKYESAWWFGLIGGGALVTLASFLLRRSQLSIYAASVQPRTRNIRNLEERPKAKKKPAETDDDELEFVDDP